MIFQQLLNEESGCLSYLIGCAEAGRAVIVDPGRDRVHSTSGSGRRACGSRCRGTAREKSYESP